MITTLEKTPNRGGDGTLKLDLFTLESYGTSGDDLVNILIDNTDYEFKV